MREFWNEIKTYFTPVNLVILLLTVIAFIIQKILGDEMVTEKFALAWWRVFDDHEYYRLITHMFLHGDLGHLFNNMLVLAFIGSMIERLMGPVKYLINYFCSGFVAALVSVAWDKWCFERAFAGEGSYIYSIGASGAVFGMAGALLVIVIINRGSVAGIDTRRMILFIVLSIYAGLTSTGIDNSAHIAGAVFGFVSGAILYDRRGGYIDEG